MEDGTAYAARVLVEGVLLSDWRFYQHRLAERHWVTVARGPVTDVQDRNGRFTRTFQKTHFTEGEWLESVEAPSPPFEEVWVNWLHIYMHG